MHFASNNDAEAGPSTLSQPREANLAEHGWNYRFRRSKTAVMCIVAMALFTDMVVYGIVVPILPLVVRDRLGGTSRDVGVLFGVYAFGLLLSTPVFAILSDKYQNRRIPMLVGMIGLAISTISFMEAETYWGLIFARIAQGCAGGASWTIGFGMLADVFPADKLGVVMGTVAAANTLGFTISPPLGGMLYQYYGYKAPFQLCTALALVDFLCVLWIAEPEKIQGHGGKDVTEIIAEVAEHQTDESQTTSERSPLIHRAQPPPLHASPEITMFTLLKNVKIIKQLVTAILAASVFAAIEPTLPIYLKKTFNADASTIGLLFMAIILPTFLSPAIGWAADKYGRRLLSCVGLLIFAASTPAIALPKNIYVEIIPLAVFGFSSSLAVTPIAPEMGSIVHDLGGGAFAQVYALYNSGYSIGMFIGPIAGGTLLDLVGFLETTLILGIGMALMIPFVVDWGSARSFFVNSN